MGDQNRRCYMDRPGASPQGRSPPRRPAVQMTLAPHTRRVSDAERAGTPMVGRVKNLGRSGFGFILVEDGEQDIYFHLAARGNEEAAGLLCGQEVAFTLAYSHDHRPQAFGVRPIGPSSRTQARGRSRERSRERGDGGGSRHQAHHNEHHGHSRDPLKDPSREPAPVPRDRRCAPPFPPLCLRRRISSRAHCMTPEPSTALGHLGAYPGAVKHS